ncbi:glycosyltransferase family 2 protein, partial [Patescibacteria group bacterium]|nr:glycosyltransferase family 2 protein [Patescibacteria group bacterium]
KYIMAEKPTVSVIIPTYNRAHLIDRSIQSVLNQTYQDFELIVVDDGSTDNTEDIIRQFQEKDKRIKYIKHDKNKGGSAARNSGIKMSCGDYIAFLDSDDEWQSKKLEKQIKHLNKNHFESFISYTGYIRVNNEGDRSVFTPIKHGDIYNDQLWNDYVSPTSAVMVKNICFKKVGLFDESLPARQDYDMWLRLSKHYTFDYIIEPLVIIYDTNKGAISNNIIARKKGENIIRLKIIKQTKNISIIKQRRILANHYYQAGRYFCGKFGTRLGREELFRAIQFWPFKIEHWLYFFTSLLGDKVYRYLVKIKKHIRKYFK